MGVGLYLAIQSTFIRPQRKPIFGAFWLSFAKSIVNLRLDACGVSVLNRLSKQ